MAGITRYHIVNTVRGPGASRFAFSEMRQPQADMLYRMIFDRLNTPLEPGQTEHINVSLAEYAAGYDKYLGIDVHLRTARGSTLTVQEKFLEKDYHHVTVEYFQDAEKGIKGDWFHMKAQLYFVGYDRHKAGIFDEWMLFNWSSFSMAIGRYNIPFKVVVNQHDGARSSLATIHFALMPDECVLAVQRYKQGIQFNHNSWHQLDLHLNAAAD